jgi:hypothetical protein
LRVQRVHWSNNLVALVVLGLLQQTNMLVVVVLLQTNK